MMDSWTQSKESYRILEKICSYIDSKQELLNVAVAFKAISPIALDALWKSMNAFYPLLLVLAHAGFLSTVTSGGSSIDNESLVRVLTATSWLVAFH
jgi:hypothetical protein